MSSMGKGGKGTSGHDGYGETIHFGGLFGHYHSSSLVRGYLVDLEFHILQSVAVVALFGHCPGLGACDGSNNSSD